MESVFQEYLGRGFSVIPLDGKKPLVSWAEYTKRLPTEEEIRAWSRQFSDCNVGIVCGLVSKLAVLDLDGPVEIDAPMTPTVQTARGHHLYFRVDKPVPSARLGDHLDLKAEGGYVVAPPSVHPTGVEYEWLVDLNTPLAPLPGWVEAILTKKVHPAVREVFKGVERGQRDVSLFRYACSLRARGLSKEEATALVLQAAQRCRPPFPEEEALVKVEQAWKYPPGRASFLASYEKQVTKGPGWIEIGWGDVGIMARLSNIKPHTDGDITAVLSVTSFNPEEKEILPRSLVGLARPGSRKTLKSELSKVHPYVDWDALVGDICSVVFQAVEEIPTLKLNEVGFVDPQFAIRPILLEGQPTILYGERASFKSYLALYLCGLAAEGLSRRPFTVTRPYKVLYLDYEQSAELLAHRLSKLFDRKPEVMYSFRSAPLAQEIDAVSKLVRDHQAELLVVDSLGPAAGGDLNEAKTALEFFAALRELHTTTLIIAHTAKNPQSKRTVFGSSYFENLARSVWEVKCLPEKGFLHVGLFHTKSNFTERFDPICLRVDFGLSVTITEDVNSPLREWTLEEQVLKFIQSGVKTTRALASALGLPTKDLLKSLHRMVETIGIWQDEKGEWQLPASPF